MAQLTINTGTSAGAGDGDTLYTAFNKVNTNFTEVYTRIIALEDGSITTNVIGDVKGSLYADDSTTLVDAISGTHYGNFVGNLTGSVVGDDSTPLVDGVGSYINLNGTVKGNIVPDTNVAYDIGSSTKRFRDLYLSGNTITIGNQTLSTTATGITSSGTLTANTIQLGTATITSSGSGIQISGNLSTGSGVTKIQGLVGFIYDVGPAGPGPGLHKIDKALFSDVIQRDYNGAVDSVSTASAQATTYTFLSGYHITDSGGSARYNRAEYKNYLDGNPALALNPTGSIIKAVTDGGGSLIGIEVDKRGENAGPGDNLVVQCINPSQETLSIDTTNSTAFYNNPGSYGSWNTVFQDYVDRSGFILDGYLRDSTGQVQGWTGYANASWNPSISNVASTYPWLQYQRRVILEWTGGSETISQDRLLDDGTVNLPVDGSGKFAGNAVAVSSSLVLKVQERANVIAYSKTYSGSFTIDGQTLNATVSFNPLQNNFGTLTSATIQGGGPIPAGTLSDLVDAETNGIVFNIDDNGTVTSGGGVTGTMGVFIYFNELGYKVLPLIGKYEDYQQSTQIAGANNTTTVLTPGPEPMPDLLALPPVLIANGTLAVADGTNWNPNGDGTQALMIYLNGQWYKVNLTPVP
jgi:hypothetical protein